MMLQDPLVMRYMKGFGLFIDISWDWARSKKILAEVKCAQEIISNQHVV